MNLPTFRAGLGVGLAIWALARVLAASDEPSLNDQMRTKLEQIRSELTELRHDLHRHPEASGEERRTSGIVARRLRALGLEVRTNVGGHGVVGLLRGGRPGAVVAYRADMDAIRTDQPDPAPFRSEIPGVRHICGHDVHTTVALGIAEAMASVRGRLPGTITFIFQPAEETVQGAKEMIRAGALENPRPTAIYALHTAPFPVGIIGCPTGMALPGWDVAVIRLQGAVDLKAAADSLTQTVLALNTVPGGGAANLAANAMSALLKDFIFPQVDSSNMRGDQWVMEFSVRASSETNYAKAKRAILAAVTAAKTGAVRIEVDYTDRRLPDAINDTQLVQAATATLRKVLGDQNALSLEGTVPYFGEDFAFFQKQVPGVLLWLGVSNPERGLVGVPHMPIYQADDGAIFVGARAMANVLSDYLEQHGGQAAARGQSNVN